MSSGLACWPCLARVSHPGVSGCARRAVRHEKYVWRRALRNPLAMARRHRPPSSPRSSPHQALLRPSSPWWPEPPRSNQPVPPSAKQGLAAASNWPEHYWFANTFGKPKTTHRATKFVILIYPLTCAHNDLGVTLANKCR